MVNCMDTNYREGGFDLETSGGQVGSFNEPCDGHDQALSLVLSILFGVGDGSCSSGWRCS